MAGPLKNLRIIEIESIGPAPFCGMHFADLGADVILIERKSSSGKSSFQDSNILHRGKSSIELDLKSSEGITALLSLLDEADALIEGMRPGVMERLGVGPDVCLARNPKLVYGRVTGWGQDGPLADAAGHDLNYLGVSGAAWYSGQAGHPPLTPPTLVGDIGGGALYLMIGILSGILNAQQTGRGDVIDAAMVDGSAHMMNLILSLRADQLFKDTRGQSILDGPHFYNAYECADGNYINIGPLEPKFYKIFLELMELDTDPLFETQYDDNRWPAQKAALVTKFKSKSRDEWGALLEGTDACFAPILNPMEAAQHPHMHHRRTYTQYNGALQAVVAPRFKNAQTTDINPPLNRAKDIKSILNKIDTQED